MATFAMLDTHIVGGVCRHQKMGLGPHDWARGDFLGSFRETSISTVSTVFGSCGPPWAHNTATVATQGHGVQGGRGVRQPRGVGPHDWARADFLDLTRTFQETSFGGAIHPLMVDGGTSDPSMPSLAPIMPGHSNPLPYSAGPDVC